MFPPGLIAVDESQTTNESGGAARMILVGPWPGSVVRRPRQAAARRRLAPRGQRRSRAAPDLLFRHGRVPGAGAARGAKNGISGTVSPNAV